MSAETNALPIIYLDARVARGLPQEPDLEKAERGIEQVEYVRSDIVEARLRRMQIPEEVIVGIASRANEREQDRVVALTSHGRLFVETTGGWKELPGPALDE